MSPWLLALVILLASALAMVGAWAYAMRMRNVGYVDVAWAWLMGGAAVAAGLFSQGALLPRALVAVLGGLWGLRLGVHLWQRVRHEPEDGRYQALRKEWNGSPTKFFVFFQMQAVVVGLFSLAFLGAAANLEADVIGWVIAAVAMWVLAVGGESIADRQLAAFRDKADNKGKTCRDGLWAWSRHPNYFFEWLHWFAYVLIGVGSPFWWLTWLGPVVMLAFLYRVSGIPWTECQALRSRGEDYRRYQHEVSAFFPWPPHHAQSSPAQDN